MVWTRRCRPVAALIAAGLFIALIAATSVHAQVSRDMTADHHMDIPVLMDKVEIGTIDAEFGSVHDLISFDALAVLGWLKPILADKIYAGLERRLAASPRMEPNALAASGLGLEFDAAALEVHLVVPAQLRRGVNLPLNQRDTSRLERELPLAPAHSSAYVNVRLGQDYVSAKGDPAAGWQSTIIDLDGAVSLFGATVEGLGTYRTGAGGGWTRGDTRLVYDFVASRTRLAAGDLSYGVDGFGTFARAGGVSFGRDFGLQPYRSSAPIGQRNLLIDRRSRVDVIVNGQRVQTIDIAPGQYNVSDFPFVVGANDVMLRVTDEVGRIDVLTFPFVYDSAVLANGEQDFHYVMGFEATPTIHGRRYDVSRPLASAFHAFGVTNQLTLGANVQASKDITMAGIEGRWATRLGTFRADIAASRAFGDIGTAARLQYRYMDATEHNALDRNIELSATYRSPAFASLGATKATNPIALDLGVRYGQRLVGPISASIGASWQKGRGAVGDSFFFDGGVSAPVSRELTAYVLLSHSRPTQMKRENRIFLALSWFPSGSGHSVTATHDSRTDASRLQWHYTPDQYLRGISADASLERNTNAHTARADVSYADYRFDARVFQVSDFAREAGAENRHRTSIALGTAVAYADGHVGLSRPITDSFALVAPHPSLAGHTIDVNAFGARPEAKTDFFGPAILPDLASYYRYQTQIDAQALPVGLDLGTDHFALLPRYRSGTLIRVGTGANVILQADLVDFAGLPMNLELGALVLPAGEGRAPLDFFTDKQGQLHVAGLRPGKIVIRLANYPESEVTLTIPEGTAGPYDAGTITMPVAVLPANRPQ